MRKGENIRQRKDGRFEARYFDDNEQKTKSVYGKNYSEAKRKRQEIFSRITPLKIEKNKITIKDICISWLTKAKTYLKKSTYANYYDKIYNHIIPNSPKGLGNIRIDRIDQNMIDKFIAYKLAQGRLDNKGGLSVKTTSDIIVPLKQILGENKLFFEYKLPTMSPVEIQILADRDYKQFFKYLLYTPDRVKVSFLLSLVTGLRVGELCGIRMKDIDLDNKRIHIQYTVQRIRNTNPEINSKTIVIVDIPKNNKTRYIPIPQFLLPLLHSIIKIMKACTL